MNQTAELYGLCNTQHTINCSKCNRADTHVNIEAYQAAEEWNKSGWRVTASQNVYCPTCAAKKLKPKK